MGRDVCQGEPFPRLRIRIPWASAVVPAVYRPGRNPMSEIYVSTDVESDGPIPGPHSLLSFASAAYRADKTLLGTFSANLELLPGASGDPATMRWWGQHPEAWQAARADLEAPQDAMPRYVQ